MLVAIFHFIVQKLYNIIIGICVSFLEHNFVVMCMQTLVSNHTCQGKHTFFETMQLHNIVLLASCKPIFCLNEPRVYLSFSDNLLPVFQQ